MPIYEYRCEACGFQKEHLQKMSEPQLTTCPDCGKESYNKLLSAAGFQLKGNGWYATDFKGGQQASRQSRKRPALPGRLPGHARLAQPVDQALLPHRTPDLGPAGHHRLGAVVHRHHPRSIVAPAARSSTSAEPVRFPHSRRRRAADAGDDPADRLACRQLHRPETGGLVGNAAGAHSSRQFGLPQRQAGFRHAFFIER